MSQLLGVHTDVPPSGQVIARIHTDLEQQGYAITSDAQLGLADDFRDHLIKQYFDQQLRCYPGDIPADRERARDVVAYAWNHEALNLTKFATTALVDRGDQPGRREYDRIATLDDPRLSAWVRAVLALVPAKRRHAYGTMGINLFRTHTNVVTRPHHDDEEYIVTYVVDRRGDGGHSRLIDPASGEVVLHHQLNPGDLLIFRDVRFLHDASPLVGTDGEPTHRDAVIATVDYPVGTPSPY